MSRFIDIQDMTAAEVIQCGYDALAIVNLCSSIAGDGALDAKTAGYVGIALGLAVELIEKVHDTVEMHEGTGSGRGNERAT